MVRRGRGEAQFKDGHSQKINDVNEVPKKMHKSALYSPTL